MRAAPEARVMTELGPTMPLHRHVLHDWERLRRRPTSLRRATGWGVGEVNDLERLVEATLATAEDGDAVLHRLVAIARDDDLAARVVLQRLLPDLARVYRRRRWQHWSGVDFGDLLTTGWTVIRTYNPDRRPARLANALVSDIEYREYRAPSRRIGHGRSADPSCFDVLVDPTTSGVTEVDAGTELAELLAEGAAAGVPDDDLELLRQLASGRSTTELAEELAVTSRTIRNRRERITTRLREVALAA